MSAKKEREGGREGRGGKQGGGRKVLASGLHYGSLQDGQCLLFCCKLVWDLRGQCPVSSFSRNGEKKKKKGKIVS